MQCSICSVLIIYSNFCIDIFTIFEGAKVVIFFFLVLFLLGFAYKREKLSAAERVKKVSVGFYKAGGQVVIMNDKDVFYRITLVKTGAWPLATVT